VGAVGDAEAKGAAAQAAAPRAIPLQFFATCQCGIKRKTHRGSQFPEPSTFVIEDNSVPEVVS